MENILAKISRDFLLAHKIYRYRMKKVETMTDAEVIKYCHWFCEENDLVPEFDRYRKCVELIESKN